MPILFELEAGEAEEWSIEVVLKLPFQEKEFDGNQGDP